MNFVSFFLFCCLLAANFFVVPVRGSLSWTFFLLVGYCFILSSNPKYVFNYPGNYRYIILSVTLPFFLLFFISGNVFLLKYLFLILFTSFLAIPIANSMCRVTSFQYKTTSRIFLAILLSLFTVNLFTPFILDFFSTRFVSPYYGFFPRFSGLNGEPGPNAFAIICCLLVLKYIDFYKNVKATSFYFPLLVLFLSLMSYSMTLSLASFFYLLAAFFFANVLTYLLRTFFSRRLKLISRFQLFLVKKTSATIVCLSFLFFLFSFSFAIVSGLSDRLATKFVETYTAISNFDLSMLPSRGFIFEKFSNEFLFTLFDFSLIYSPSPFEDFENVSMYLNVIQQGSLLFLLLFILLLAFSFFITLPFRLLDFNEGLFYSYLRFKLFAYFFLSLSLVTLPEIHLYRLVIVLSFDLIASHKLNLLPE